jgi:hypothetical protein
MTEAGVARARELLAELAAAERAYLATSPYRLIHENDMRAGRYLVRVKVVTPVPTDIPRLALAVVRTLRTALDELTTTLARRPVRFPIYESLALFAQRSRKAIAGMSDEAQATLEALQPYHAIGGYRNGQLWTLQQLEAEDPQELSAGFLRSATMGVNTQRKTAIVGEPSVVTGPFTDGGIVASAVTKIVGPDPKLDMFLRAEYGTGYAPHSAGVGREVLPLLTELCEHVERIVFPALTA